MGKKRWIDLPHVPSFLRVKPSRALGALECRGVRVGEGDYLINADELMLSESDIVNILNEAGVKVDIDPEEVTIAYSSVLAQFACELALVKRDIKLLEWTVGSLNGLIDETSLSPWRPKRSWRGLSSLQVAKKIEWEIATLTRMVGRLDMPIRWGSPMGSSADVLRESKRLRRGWRKFLAEKTQK